MSQHVRRTVLAALLVASAASMATAGADAARCARQPGEPPPVESLDARPAGNYAVDQGYALAATGQCAYRTGAVCAVRLADRVVNEQLDASFATGYAACTTGLATGQ